MIGCAIEVHRILGPGLLESAYEQCLAREMQLCGLSFQTQRPVAVEYKGIRLDCGYRIDIVVKDQLIVELKSMEQLHSVHVAQLLSYMKLANIPTGLLINFNVYALKDGLRRFVL